MSDETTSAPMLAGIRVVDLTAGIAGPYCSKLFADAGADVVKIEPLAGDPLRAWRASGDAHSAHDGTGALFRYLNHGKRSVVGSAGDDRVEGLVGTADVVLEDLPSADHADRWHRAHAGLVVVSITAFGRTGPYAGRPATHFTIEAEAGSLAMRGRGAIAPFQAGGRIAEWVTGAYAAVAALACARRARRTGHGEHVDCSIHETMTISGGLFLDMMSSLLGRPDWPHPPRTLETPSIEPTADGWIGVNTNTRQQFEDFLVLIDRLDLLGDEQLATAVGRVARFEEWNEIVHAATRTRTTAELVEQATALRIPVAPVCDGRSVLEHPQFAARGVFVDAPDGTFRMPRAPYLVNGEPVAVPGPAPALGAHDGSVEQRSAARPDAQGPPALPLAGLRVVDLTNWWAGPSGSHMLAVLGADVLKIESIQKADGMRYAGVPAPGSDSWWEYGFMFLCANSNKRSLTLDLGSSAGVDIAKRLVRGADVVMENFSPRVVESFGLDWPAVHDLNPRAVMVRMPAFGLSGPWRDNVGFAQTMEQVTGMAWITGHRDDQPRIPRGPCDPNAGMHAVFALLAALEQRDRTGEGVLVESAMVETALNVAAEQVVEHTAYGSVLERDGNRSPDAAPQGIYACGSGPEDYVAVSIGSDEQWRRLCDAIDAADLAGDEALAARAGRRVAHDALDERIAAWTAKQDDVAGAVEHLVAHGVPAAPLVDTRATARHPHLVTRGFYEELDHPVVGRHAHPSAPFRFASVDRWLHRPAPTLGEHNREVLAELGLSEAEVAALEESHVVGTRPLGA